MLLFPGLFPPPVSYSEQRQQAHISQATGAGLQKQSCMLPCGLHANVDACVGCMLMLMPVWVVLYANTLEAVEP